MAPAHGWRARRSRPVPLPRPVRPIHSDPALPVPKFDRHARFRRVANPFEPAGWKLLERAQADGVGQPMKLMGSLRQFERLIDRLSVVIRCNLVAASGVRSTFRSPHFWFVFWNRRHARPMLRSPRGSCNIMPLSAWAEASALAAGHRHEKAAAGLRSAAASIRISDHQKVPATLGGRG